MVSEEILQLKIKLLEQQVKDRDNEIERLNAQLDNGRYYLTIGLERLRVELKKTKTVIAEAMDGALSKPQLYIDHESPPEVTE